jgi:hypothetical protein
MKSFKRIPTLLVLALGGLVITSTAFADLVKVSVNGMVCGFCGCAGGVGGGAGGWNEGGRGDDNAPWGALGECRSGG